MRIIAFVGSPVEDNEKDVSLKFLPSLRERVVGDGSNLFHVSFSGFPSACEDGKTLEKRKSECGHYQLWRGGEE